VRISGVTRGDDGLAVALIGALANLSNPNAEHQLRDLQTAARTLGQEVVVFGAKDEQEIDNSFAGHQAD
jgi:putative ABC transport system substrate-binding protein